MKIGVKQLRGGIGQTLMGFGLAQPIDGEEIHDDKLMLLGWIIGKDKIIEKIVLTGILAMEIPIAIHRPDVIAAVGGASMCPIIDGIERCGFSKQINIPQSAQSSVCDVKAVFADGNETLIATIVISIPETITDTIALVSKPAAAPAKSEKMKSTATVAKKKNKRRR